MKKAAKWLCLLLLIVFSFRQADMIRGGLATISMRFSSALNADQVAASRQYSEYFDAPWATFWREDRVELSGIAATAIGFSGDAQAAFPADYIYGSAPNTLSPTECALSSALAWEIFGFVDATGMTLAVGSGEYGVCGIFDHEEAVLIYVAEDGFTAAEINGIPPGADAWSAARDYAAACGFGVPDEILCGPDYSAAAGLLPWSGIALCVGKWLPEIRKRKRRSFGWLAAVLLVAAMPLWIDWLPQWWIPTRWSDSGFWAGLWESLGSRFRDWLAFDPALRDISVKAAWVKLLWATAGTWFLLWNQSGRRPDSAAIAATKNEL